MIIEKIRTCKIVSLRVLVFKLGVHSKKYEIHRKVKNKYTIKSFYSYLCTKSEKKTTFQHFLNFLHFFNLCWHHSHSTLGVGVLYLPLLRKLTKNHLKQKTKTLQKIKNLLFLNWTKS